MKNLLITTTLLSSRMQYPLLKLPFSYRITYLASSNSSSNFFSVFGVYLKLIMVAVSMNKSRKFTAFIFINVLLSVFCTIANAQIDDGGDDIYAERPRIFSVGVVAGANFTQIDGDSYAGYHKIGANFGGIGYARLYRHVALSFEMLYSQKGALSNDVRYSPIDSSTLITRYDVALNYAEIPIMINYFDQRKSHFGLGMSYSRLIGSNESMKTDPHYYIDFNKYPFRKDSYDVVASAQMHVWKGLFFNIRFQYALSPARAYSPPSLSRSQKQYNNLWSVRLLYIFI